MFFDSGSPDTCWLKIFDHFFAVDKYLEALDHGSFEDLRDSSGVWGFEIKFVG